MMSFLATVGFFALLIASISAKTCSVGRYGKVKTFSGEDFNVELPCKYRLAEFECSGLQVQVIPGSALDDNRFTPDTVWVSIKEGNKEWTGRTGGNWLNKRTEDPSQKLWEVKESSLGVNVEFGYEEATMAARVTTANGNLEIMFREVLTSGDDAGVTIHCNNDFTNSLGYPGSFCGDGVEEHSMNRRKQELYGTNDLYQSRSSMFDALNDDRIAQSAPCDVTSFIFQNDCGTQQQKLDAINVCGTIFDKRPLTKCLVEDGDIVGDFRKCIISQCGPTACNQVKSVAENTCQSDAKLTGLLVKPDGYLNGLLCN